MENLQAAFAGESQANRKYLAFAKQAEKDGFPQIARLFRAVAAAETVHAHNHFRLGGVGTTGETEPALLARTTKSLMYPELLPKRKAVEKGSTLSNGPGK
jgi:rubrerythrin